MAAPVLRRLNIEITARCNLKCEMCVRHVWQEGLGDMSLETFRKLIPVFHQLEYVNLSGIGEPLLHRDVLEMIRLARANLPPEGKVSFTSNALMLDKAMAEKLALSGLDDIVISVDGASPATYNAIRCGGKLENVLQGIRTLSETKQRLGSKTPRIGIEFVAMKKNIDELPSLVDLAAGLGVTFLIVSHVLPHTEEMSKQVLYEFCSNEALAIFEEARAEAHRHSLTMAFYPEFIPYIYSLFGMPPLRGMNAIGQLTSRDMSNDKQKLLHIIEKAASKALKQNTVLNFTKLAPEDGTKLAHVLDIFNQARAKAEKYGIELDLPSLVPNTQRECGFIKNGICFISWDGYVRPCNNLNHTYTCFINDRLKHVTSRSFGNVLNKGLNDIYKQEEYREFRDQVDRFDFAPCGDCNFADACYFLHLPVFERDCYGFTLPCGDCPWARGILKCF